MINAANIIAQLSDQIVSKNGKHNKISLTDITADSRAVLPGNLYICTDSKKNSLYCLQALEKGALAIVYAENLTGNPWDEYPHVFFLQIKNPKQIVGKLAKLFYPDIPRNIVTVTGTNGKTSVANIFQKLLNLAGNKAAAIGTLGVTIGDKNCFKLIENLTTLTSIELFKTLAKLKQQHHVDYVCFEASSIGIEQHRCDGIPIKAAVFTNFSQDHLDYHQTMQNYQCAKERLFLELLPKNAVAILNMALPFYQTLRQRILQQTQVKSFSILDNTADFFADAIVQTPKGNSFSLHYQQKTYNLSLPLIGEFQIENFLAAISLITSCEINIPNILAHTEKLTGIKGRMEYMGTSKLGGSIFIDYAHTPDALEKSLLSLKKIQKAKLYVLFGCGGDRDQLKRPIMGTVAANNADKVFITDDNPRNENPSIIRHNIIEGFIDKTKVIEIASRKSAIVKAIETLEKDDILLIAGKGHEEGQTIQGKVHPFSDQLEVKKCL